MIREMVILTMLGIVHSAAHAAPSLPTGGKVDIMPLEKVKRGQKGIGLTTFYGTKPEQFSFEVIDVKHNFLPNMSIILVKSDDPKLQIPGFWRGMSGSPLFINGKLTCAFSYGWRFTKTPIGACTPMKYMLEQGFKTPLRGAAQNGSASKALTQKSQGSWQQYKKLVPKGDLNKFILGKSQTTAPSMVPQVALPSELVPQSIPVSIAGITPRALSEANKLFANTGLVPMRGGGLSGKAKADGPSRFVLGSSIAVMLIRGDMTAAGTGTVSYVDGPRILAFGHPMFESGEIYAPIATSHVHMVVNSGMSPFVVASPIKEVGSLVLDKQAMIMSDMRLRTQMIPLSIDIERDVANKKQKKQFKVEVLNNQYLTSTLIRVASINAASLHMPDRDPVTMRLEGTIKVEGVSKPLRFVDYHYSDEGATGAVLRFRGFRAIDALLYNPYKQLRIESVKINMRAVVDKEPEFIDDVKLSTPKFIPGKKNYVDLVLRRRGAKKRRKRIWFDVPETLAGQMVRLQIVGGNVADFDAAIPQDFPSYLNALRSFFAGDKLLVQLTPAAKGMSMGDRVVRDLPPSVADRLAVKAGVLTQNAYQPVYRTEINVDRVIANAKGFVVDIDDLK